MEIFGFKIKKELEPIALLALCISLVSLLLPMVPYIRSIGEGETLRVMMLPDRVSVYTLVGGNTTTRDDMGASLVGTKPDRSHKIRSLSVVVLTHNASEINTVHVAQIWLDIVLNGTKYRYEWNDKIIRSSGESGQQVVEVSPYQLRPGESVSGQYLFSLHTVTATKVSKVDVRPSLGQLQDHIENHGAINVNVFVDLVQGVDGDLNIVTSSSAVRCQIAVSEVSRVIKQKFKNPGLYEGLDGLYVFTCTQDPVNN